MFGDVTIMSRIGCVTDVNGESTVSVMDDGDAADGRLSQGRIPYKQYINCV